MLEKLFPTRKHDKQPTERNGTLGGLLYDLELQPEDGMINNGESVISLSEVTRYFIENKDIEKIKIRLNELVGDGTIELNKKGQVTEINYSILTTDALDEPTLHTLLREASFKTFNESPECVGHFSIRIPHKIYADGEEHTYYEVLTRHSDNRCMRILEMPEILEGIELPKYGFARLENVNLTDEQYNVAKEMLEDASEHGFYTKLVGTEEYIFPEKDRSTECSKESLKKILENASDMSIYHEITNRVYFIDELPDKHRRDPPGSIIQNGTLNITPDMIEGSYCINWDEGYIFLLHGFIGYIPIFDGRENVVYVLK